MEHVPQYTAKTAVLAEGVLATLFAPFIGLDDTSTEEQAAEVEEQGGVITVGNLQLSTSPMCLFSCACRMLAKRFQSKKRTQRTAQPTVRSMLNYTTNGVWASTLNGIVFCLLNLAGTVLLLGGILIRGTQLLCEATPPIGCPTTFRVTVETSLTVLSILGANYCLVKVYGNPGVCGVPKEDYDRLCAFGGTGKQDHPSAAASMAEDGTTSIMVQPEARGDSGGDASVVSEEERPLSQNVPVAQGLPPGAIDQQERKTSGAVRDVVMWKHEEVRMYKKWCPSCQWWRPPRSSHCGACNVCISEHDHHCGILGTCVGRRNRKYFIWFLIWTAMICNMALVGSARTLYWLNDSQIATIPAASSLFLILILVFWLVPLNLGASLLLYCYGVLGVTLREFQKKGGLYDGFDYETSFFGPGPGSSGSEVEDGEQLSQLPENPQFPVHKRRIFVGCGIPRPWDRGVWGNLKHYVLPSWSSE